MPPPRVVLAPCQMVVALCASIMPQWFYLVAGCAAAMHHCKFIEELYRNHTNAMRNPNGTLANRSDTTMVHCGELFLDPWM